MFLVGFLLIFCSLCVITSLDLLSLVFVGVKLIKIRFLKLFLIFVTVLFFNFTFCGKNVVFADEAGKFDTVIDSNDGIFSDDFIIKSMLKRRSLV